MMDAGSKLGQRLKHEAPFVHSRVWQCQYFVMDREIVIQEQINIENPWP